ncbi:MAG: ankyrin repeat domain-containing protein [Polyangiaceae bacterium]
MTDSWTSWTLAWSDAAAKLAERGFEVNAVRIDPPAMPADIAAVETALGRSLPKDLRDVFSKHAAAVHFGWKIPAARRTSDLPGPTSGGLHGLVFGLVHLRDHAIRNFENWRAELAARSDGEQPNTPALWENHVAFAELVNGDMLAIDCSSPSREPVRYFSHELEGLHGREIAPDWVSFVTEYSKLACAGVEHSDWFRFCVDENGSSYLRADSSGGLKWLDFLAHGASAATADDPPPRIAARTAADLELLMAVEAGELPEAIAALEGGAHPDAVMDAQPLGDEALLASTRCQTALTLAARAGNLEMMEALHEHGAALATERLALDEAILGGHVAAVAWLLDHGARANGWRAARMWPLHLLVETMPRRKLASADYLAMLDALLAAGADVNAPWDNGIRMLSRCGPVTAERLLAHGADPLLCDAQGLTTLHSAQSADTLRLLLARGIDPNVLSTPSKGEDAAHAPLHHHLMSWEPHTAHVSALLDAGADPKLRDSAGAPPLFYAGHAPDLALLLRAGIDLAARDTKDQPALHWLVRFTAGRIASRRAYVEALALAGYDLDARDAAGATALALVTNLGEPDDVQVLRDLGAKT